MRKQIVQVIVALVAIVVPAVCYGERQDLIEVRVAGKTYTGQVASRNASSFWLLQRDGQLVRLPVAGVKEIRSLSSRFTPLRATELRSRLRAEFGREFEVAGTKHYLVVAPKGHARRYARLFEDVYRRFVTYFRARKFRLKSPKAPLIAIVFPNRQEFAEYAKRDGVSAALGFVGYYQRRTNRVAVFDTIKSRSQTKIGRQAKSIIVHETTHQVAFNTGLHSRIGAVPRWVSEGLATVFEATGIRRDSGDGSRRSRVNAGRLKRFRKYAKKRGAGSLAAFLTSDDPFRATTFDAYAEAWALSFFLIETRSKKYTKYLRALARRDPLQPYYAADRLKDFQAAFGKDLGRLEVDFLRFTDGLEVERQRR